MNKPTEFKGVSEGEEYRSPTAGGHHGTLYQIKLLLHSTVLCKIKKISSFKISTERKEFGNFDDICIEYTTLKKGANCQIFNLILMQAKHKLNPAYQKISEKEFFLDKKKDYAIYKYFKCFLQFVQNKISDKIDKIYIVTNTWFDEDLQSKSYFIAVPNEKYNFFNFGQTYQLDPLNENIINILKTYSDLEATDSDYELFMKKFVFIINTPSQDDLDQYIVKAMKDDLNLEFFDVIHFQKYFLAFLNNMICNEIKPYLTIQKVNEFYIESKLKLATLNKFKSFNYGIKFSSKDKLMTEFNDFLTDNLNKIIIVKTNNIPLTSYKISQCIPEHFKLNQSIVLTHEKELLQDEVADVLKKNLQSLNTVTIILADYKIDVILQKLEINESGNDILQSKIVIISMKKIRSTFKTISDELQFEHFSEESREKLLQRNVKFLYDKLTFKQLLRNDSRIDMYGDLFTNDVLIAVLDTIKKDHNKEIGDEGQLDLELCSRENSEPLDDLYITRKLFIEEDELIPENKIFDELNEHNNIIIITGVAGMGKSLLLKSIQSEFHVLCKVNKTFEISIHIELIKVQKILNDFKNIEFDRENITNILVEFFKVETKSKFPSFSEKLIRYHLNYAEPLLLIDGIDEVTPHYSELVFNLIKGIQEVFKNIRIILTCRPSVIENFINYDFDVFFQIKQLTQNEQITYLIKHWKNTLSVDYCETIKSILEHSAALVINCLYENLEEEITYIPLLINMLAEIHKVKLNKNIECITKYLDEIDDRDGEVGFIKNMDQDYNFKDIETDFNFFDLYEKFMESQFDYHYEIKEGYQLYSNAYLIRKQNLYKEFIRDHEALALWSEFSGADLEKMGMLNDLKGKWEILTKQLSSNEHNYGVIKLIRSTGELHFIHYTYVEYFIANYFMNTLQKNCDEDYLVKKFFICEILCGNFYLGIISFCEEWLRQNSIEKMKEVSQLLINTSVLQEIIAKINSKFKCETEYENVLTDKIYLLEIEGCLNFLNALYKETPKTLNYFNFSELKKTIFQLVLQNLKILTDKIQLTSRIKIKDGEIYNSTEVFQCFFGHLLENFYFQICYCLLYHLDENIKKNIINCDMDENKNKILHFAAKNNVKVLVEHLLKYDIDVNAKNKYRESSGFLAITHNNLDIAKLMEERNNLGYMGVLQINTLLSKISCDEDESSLKRKSNFHLTLENFKNFHMKNIQLKPEADKETFYKNSFLLASKCGNSEILNYLLDLSIFNNDIISKGLLQAAVYGHLNIIQILLKKVTNFNEITNGFGNSILILASQFNHIDVVNYLLHEEKIEIDAENNDKETAFFIAVQYGYIDIVEVLMRHGANNSHQNINGYSPLRISCRKKYPYSKIRDILLKDKTKLHLLYDSLYANLTSLNEKYCRSTRQVESSKE